MLFQPLIGLRQPLPPDIVDTFIKQIAAAGRTCHSVLHHGDASN